MIPAVYGVIPTIPLSLGQMFGVRCRVWVRVDHRYEMVHRVDLRRPRRSFNLSFYSIASSTNPELSHITTNMPDWTHLIRFVAADGQTHLGQLVDTTRNIGGDSLNGIPIKAFRLEGTIHSGQITEEVLQVDREVARVRSCAVADKLALNHQSIRGSVRTSDVSV